MSITKNGLYDFNETLVFCKNIGNPKPIFALFPKQKGACIHIDSSININSEQLIERHLKKNPDLSLGIIVAPRKEIPSDWGEKEEHHNKKGNLRTFGASDCHIKHCQALFIEGDNAELSTSEQITCIQKAGLPIASDVIFTGGKSCHFYWRLDKPIDTDRWTDLQKRLIKLVKQKAPELKVDEKLTNPARVMRVAGGKHAKTGYPSRDIGGMKCRYVLEDFEKLLPPLQDQIPIKPVSRFISPIDEGWFSRRPREQHHGLAVEMLRFLPKIEQQGKGEYSDTCIPVLMALKHHFGESEAISICIEAGWESINWNPVREIAYCHNPTNKIGTLVHHARKNGWQYPLDVSTKQAPQLEELFPKQIAADLREQVKYLDFDDHLVATTFLSACCPLLKLGASITCCAATDYEQPLILFVATIGDSGARKSPLQKLLITNILKPLRDAINKENFRKSVQHAKDLAVWSKAKKKTEKPTSPTYPWLIIEDATGEALEEQLIHQEKSKKSLLRLSDELIGVFKSFGAYKQGRGRDEEALLTFYDGAGFSTKRVGSERVCSQTALSIYGAFQPEVLKDLMKAKDDNGKFARFIFSYCQSNPKPLPSYISDTERKQIKAAKDRLVDFAEHLYELDEVNYELSEESYKRFVEHNFECQKKAATAKKPSHAALFGKSSGKVARVAGILHAINKIEDDKIDCVVPIATVDAAIKLIDYLDDWTINFWLSQQQNPIERILKRLLNIAAKAKSPMAANDIYTALTFDDRKKYSAEEIRDFLRKLEELGLGEISEGVRGGMKFKSTKPWPM